MGGDLFGRMAGRVGDLDVPALLGGERLHRPQHLVGFFAVVVAHRCVVEKAPDMRGQRRDHGERREVVAGAEQFVMGGQVGQHALGVFAAVDRQEDLHFDTSAVSQCHDGAADTAAVG
jgi:hypothetical protein